VLIVKVFSVPVETSENGVGILVPVKGWVTKFEVKVTIDPFRTLMQRSSAGIVKSNVTEFEGDPVLSVNVVQFPGGIAPLELLVEPLLLVDPLELVEPLLLVEPLVVEPLVLVVEPLVLVVEPLELVVVPPLLLDDPVAESEQASAVREAMDDRRMTRSESFMRRRIARPLPHCKRFVTLNALRLPRSQVRCARSQNRTKRRASLWRTQAGPKKGLERSFSSAWRRFEPGSPSCIIGDALQPNLIVRCAAGGNFLADGFAQDPLRRCFCA
jgi:hypothetical protein